MNRKAVLHRIVLSLFSLLTLEPWARAEVLRGELVADGLVRFQDLMLEVVTSQHMPAARVQLGTDGRFEVPNLEPGHYFIRVTTLRGDLVREESVHLAHHTVPVQIRLTTPDRQAPAGHISLRRLAHKPPKSAQRAWAASAKLYLKGEHTAAIKQLEQTVALDPEYFEAQALLGDEHLRAGQPAQAITAYERALEIDPSAVGVLVNQGLALLHARRAPEAQAVAEKALMLDGTSITAHFILGLTLAQLGSDREGAEKHLKAAAERFPQARLALRWLAEGQAAPPQ